MKKASKYNLNNDSLKKLEKELNILDPNKKIFKETLIYIKDIQKDKKN